MPDSFIDYYSLLGVSKTATEREITFAFRRQSLLHHPDKNPKKEVTEASLAFVPYVDAKDILTDPILRARYDRLHAIKTCPPHPSSSHRWNPKTKQWKPRPPHCSPRPRRQRAPQPPPPRKPYSKRYHYPQDGFSSFHSDSASPQDPESDSSSSSSSPDPEPAFNPNFSFDNDHNSRGQRQERKKAKASCGRNRKRHALCGPWGGKDSWHHLKGENVSIRLDRQTYDLDDEPPELTPLYGDSNLYPCLRRHFPCDLSTSEPQDGTQPPTTRAAATWTGSPNHHTGR
jgi:curved DNA-binding protein CbpA